MLTVAGEINGFRKWLNEPAWLNKPAWVLEPGMTGGVWVAAFDNNGLALTEGFHTLTTTTSMSGRYYTAFIYGHGPDGTNASYGYLAGYDRKYNFKF